jgi:hypothetical protein
MLGSDRRDCGGVCACTRTPTPHLRSLNLTWNLEPGTWNQCDDDFLTWQASLFLGEVFGPDAADHDTSVLSQIHILRTRTEASLARTLRRKERHGPLVTDRVLRIAIGACTCVAFLLLRAGKNNVMAKWCAPPVLSTPLSHTTHTGGSSVWINILLESSVWPSTGKPSPFFGWQAF